MSPTQRVLFLIIFCAIAFFGYFYGDSLGTSNGTLSQGGDDFKTPGGLFRSLQKVGTKGLDQFLVGFQNITDEEERVFGKDMEKSFFGTLKESPRLASLTLKFRPLLKRDLNFRVYFYEADYFNAFSFPGGMVAITSKLFEKANEDQLALLLGHEFAHLELKHQLDRLSYTIRHNRSLLLNMGNLTRSFLSQGYSVEKEYDADLLGLELAIKGGFNPQVGITLFDLLKSSDPKTKPKGIIQDMEMTLGDFFKSHPDSGDRITRLRKILQKKGFKG